MITHQIDLIGLDRRALSETRTKTIRQASRDQDTSYVTKVNPSANLDKLRGTATMDISDPTERRSDRRTEAVSGCCADDSADRLLIRRNLYILRYVLWTLIPLIATTRRLIVSEPRNLATSLVRALLTQPRSQRADSASLGEQDRYRTLQTRSPSFLLSYVSLIIASRSRATWCCSLATCVAIPSVSSSTFLLSGVVEVRLTSTDFHLDHSLSCP